MTEQNSILANTLKKMSRAELKSIVGGYVKYNYSDSNPTIHGTPGVGCYVTCDATVTSGSTTTSVPGGLACATYAVC